MNYETSLSATRLNILWSELIEVNVDTPWFKSVTDDHFHLALHDKSLSQMTASLSYAQRNEHHFHQWDHAATCPSPQLWHRLHTWTHISFGSHVSRTVPTLIKVEVSNLEAKWDVGWDSCIPGSYLIRNLGDQCSSQDRFGENFCDAKKKIIESQTGLFSVRITTAGPSKPFLQICSESKRLWWVQVLHFIIAWVWEQKLSA